MSNSERTVDFGFEKVAWSEKAERVRSVFASVAGKTYVILYSSDLTATNWNIATPSVQASANVTQWYDDGPPKTASKPDSVDARYYRVIQY